MAKRAGPSGHREDGGLRRTRASGDESRGPLAREEQLIARSEHRELLTCDLCMGFMSPPIWQCLNGHTCCAACEPRLRGKCPTCHVKRKKMSRVRVLEKMAHTFLWPCEHQPQGCTEVLAYTNLAAHEAQCHYRPYSCPQGSCDFTGNIAAIIAHLRDRHLARTFNSGDTMAYSGKDRPHPRGLSRRFGGWQDDRLGYPMMVSFHEEHFLVSIAEFHPGACEAFALSVFFLGEEEEAKGFTCKVEVTGGGGEVSRKAPPISMRTSSRGSHLIVLRGDNSVIQERSTGQPHGVAAAEVPDEEVAEEGEEDEEVEEGEAAETTPASLCGCAVLEEEGEEEEREELREEEQRMEEDVEGGDTGGHSLQQEEDTEDFFFNVRAWIERIN